jgi:hypothetical protein
MVKYMSSYEFYENLEQMFEKFDNELPNIQAKWRYNLLRDVFKDEERAICNSLDWFSQILDLYYKIRYSLIQAFAYGELKSTYDFRYYCENAILRIYSLLEKCNRLIRCRYKKSDKRIDEPLTLLDGLKNDPNIRELIERFRHPDTHRRAPWLVEMKDTPFILTQQNKQTIQMGAGSENYRWDMNELKTYLVRGFVEITKKLKNLMPLLYNEKELEYEIL